MAITKFVIIFAFIGCITSEDLENHGILNEACSDDIQALRMELTALREEVLHQKEEIKELKEEVARKPDKCEQIQSYPTADETVESFQTQNETPHTEEGSNSSHLKQDRRIRRQELTHPTSGRVQQTAMVPRIAFHANSPKDHSNLAVHQNLIFDNAITNFGNKYHHATGVFTPDVSGVYVFYVQLVMCATGHSVNTELVVEGVGRAGHFVYSKEVCANGGGMTIVHVNTGDSVWVRLSVSDGVNAFGWESSFSGFLLYEDQ